MSDLRAAFRLAQALGALLGRGGLLLDALPLAAKPMKSPRPVQCVWFKRDLRVSDHHPLVEASRRGPVLLLYIVEPSLVRAPDFDALHWNFIRQSLHELNARIEAMGAALQVIHGEVVEVLNTLHARHGFECLWAHEETGNGLTYQRDREVASWCRRVGVRFRELPQNGVVRGLRNRDGWSRVWEQRMAAPSVPVPDRLTAPARLAPGVIPKAAELGLQSPSRAGDLVGGERAAWAALDSFINRRGQRYHREMSSPNTAYESCSRLSAYLAWGCISMRSVVQAVRGAAGERMPKVAARAFLSRCHWHCHFMQKLETEPEIEYHAFNRACDQLRENGNNPDFLAAWKNGRTGYPFVDACMRSLRERGWINFRMRAMLVSFAAYDLWLDWRLFKDWLACQFVDYEPGIHISQIQMQSGLTGINTLRIYSPVKQGRDHDPDGTFIRRWVPELRGVSDGMIHEPWTLSGAAQAESGCRIGVDYPLPVVDHLEAVRSARRAFSEVRRRDAYREASREVMRRHGSRKGARGGRRTKQAAVAQSQQGELELDHGQADRKQ